ncbi:uncharacterized protein VTP21DRAFT_8008 [Calcarisporiella thermophila]|uniref:uncharacterized protein n=1 Tax=Calcarisporiella thermophila TaxID=911321 RepID=UPI0037443F0C
MLAGESGLSRGEGRSWRLFYGSRVPVDESFPGPSNKREGQVTLGPYKWEFSIFPQVLQSRSGTNPNLLLHLHPSFILNSILIISPSLPLSFTMDPSTKRAVNLSVLRRHDKTITEILDSSSHVVIYKFNSARKEWEKKGVEGTMFIFKRSVAPVYGFFIMNRLSIENFHTFLTSDVEIQLSSEFIIYRTSDDNIHGIWIYERDDKERIGQRLLQCCSLSHSIEPPPMPPPQTASPGAAIDPPKFGKQIDVLTLFQQAAGKEPTDQPQPPPQSQTQPPSQYQQQQQQRPQSQRQDPGNELLAMLTKRVTSNGSLSPKSRSGSDHASSQSAKALLSMLHQQDPSRQPLNGTPPPPPPSYPQPLFSNQQVSPPSSSHQQMMYPYSPLQPRPPPTSLQQPWTHSPSLDLLNLPAPPLPPPPPPPLAMNQAPHSHELNYHHSSSQSQHSEQFSRAAASALLQVLRGPLTRKEFGEKFKALVQVNGLSLFSSISCRESK